MPPTTMVAHEAEWFDLSMELDEHMSLMQQEEEMQARLGEFEQDLQNRAATEVRFAISEYEVALSSQAANHVGHARATLEQSLAEQAARGAEMSAEYQIALAQGRNELESRVHNEVLLHEAFVAQRTRRTGASYCSHELELPEDVRGRSSRDE